MDKINTKRGRRYTCPNCGAAIESERCPYCGTLFIDFAEMNIDGTPFHIKIADGHGGHVKAKVVLKSGEITQSSIDTCYRGCSGELLRCASGFPPIIEFKLTLTTIGDVHFIKEDNK